MRTVDEIRSLVVDGVMRYNESAADGRRVVRVDLFGSYADGSASERSDIDLLVELRTPMWACSPWRQSFRLWSTRLGCKPTSFKLRCPLAPCSKSGRRCPSMRQRDASILRKIVEEVDFLEARSAMRQPTISATMRP